MNVYIFHAVVLVTPNIRVIDQYKYQHTLYVRVEHFSFVLNANDGCSPLALRY